MPKKPKGKKGSEGGGAGSGGKGVDDAKEKLSEVDKEWFQIQIKALEEKLQGRKEG